MGTASAISVSAVSVTGALLGSAMAACLMAGCGGTASTGFTPTDGGTSTGGAPLGSSGGATNPAGGSNASGGVVGRGAGGSPSVGGGQGAGGAVTAIADAGPCKAPATAGTTHLCLTLSPEKITPRAEPELDERGILVVQIFNTPNPPTTDADKVALAQRILPQDANFGTDGGVGGEVALSDLKVLEFEDAFPAAVYVRALFVDNRNVLGNKTGELGFGTWIGGVNLDDGFQDKEPLTAVPIQRGVGNAIDLKMTALRRFRVTVQRSATPIGDGEGPLNVIAVSDADPAVTPPLYGAAKHKCANLATEDVTINGFVVGSRPLYVYGNLNDLGTPGNLPAGSLASLVVTPTALLIPTKLVYAATDYAVATTIDLNYVVPWGADAGSVPPNSCADLGLAPGDAGP